MDKQSGKNFDRPAWKQLAKKLKPGDLLELKFGERVTRVKVLSVQEIVGKADAAGMYEEVR